MITNHRSFIQQARIVIADDHELARAGLRGMLADAPDLLIVGEAAGGREAVALCRSTQPQLVLLDVRMPDMDGIAAARQIRREFPSTSIMIVTISESQDTMLEALRAGVAGYVLKDATRRELLAAVRQVLRGESFLNHELTTKLLHRLTNANPPHAAPSVERLTAREHDVLHLLAQGYTNRRVAQRLVISVGTVKVHVEHIIAKLGVSDRTQAAVRALELGLISSGAD